MPESDQLSLDGGIVTEFPKVKLWQMVTSQRNLFYQIASGLIMPPQGFGSKYYLDTAAAFPGYLPIFPGNVSHAAVEISISETTHLIPCVLNLELNCLSGPVKIITHQGEVKDVNFQDVDSSCQLMLVPAPLPITFIKAILCRSRDEKLGIETDAKDFNNVDISDYLIKTAAGAFSKLKTGKWPPAGIDVDPVSITLNVPIAAGAMMAVLSNMSNRGELTVSAGKMAFDPESSSSILTPYPVITAMGEWLQSGRSAGVGDVSQKLFWNIVSHVSAANNAAEKSSALDVAIGYLEAMPSDEFDQRARSYGEKLALDLRRILGLADSTISEIFERHPRPVSRAMTLFVLREKIEDLLEFYNPQLTEADYVLAAILFAAREGWIGLSNDLRDFPGLKTAVSHRMAAIAHNIAGSKLDLGPCPARPQSLIELLTSGEAAKPKAKKEAAVYLARKMKWKCLQTRINLGKGDYQMAVSTAGIQLTLEGDVKAVVTEVLEKEFMSELLAAEIPSNIERKVREMLKDAK